MLKGSVKIDLRGSENVRKNLVKKVIQKSVRNNSKIILNAVKANVKSIKRTGNLYKSLTKKQKSYGETVVSIVGPKSSFQVVLGVYTRGKNYGQSKIYRPSKIFHLLERGAKHVQARHPLDNAQKSTATPFAEAVTADIRAGIQELAP